MTEPRSKTESSVLGCLLDTSLHSWRQSQRCGSEQFCASPRCCSQGRLSSLRHTGLQCVQAAEAAPGVLQQAGFGQAPLRESGLFLWCSTKLNVMGEDIKASTDFGLMYVWLMWWLAQVHLFYLWKKWCLAGQFLAILCLSTAWMLRCLTPKHVFLKSPTVDVVVAAVLSPMWSC